MISIVVVIVISIVIIIIITIIIVTIIITGDSYFQKLNSAHDHSNGSLKPSQNGLCFPALNGEAGATTLLAEALPPKELPKDIPRDMSVRSRVRGEAGESF